MIHKTNLLDSRSPESESVQIVPGTSSVIVYERDVTLPSCKEYLSDSTDSDDEILYFLEGEGIVRIDPYAEPVRQGDRVLIKRGSPYVVLNPSDNSLRFLHIGTNLKR
jgi:uncharacterized cupin superfamily protein